MYPPVQYRQYRQDYNMLRPCCSNSYARTLYRDMGSNDSKNHIIT